MQYRPKTFLASDHHFFHQKILDFGIRGKVWNNIEDHNEALINNHNSVVGVDDKVYFGGDLILGVDSATIALKNALNDTVGRMNGKKYLLLGNHCTPAKVETYVNSGLFAGVCGHWLFGVDIFFCHVPVHTSQMGRWKVNIHGHTHESNTKIQGTENNDLRYFNVSMENINYIPVELSAVKQIMRDRGIL